MPLRLCKSGFGRSSLKEVAMDGWTVLSFPPTVFLSNFFAKVHVRAFVCRMYPASYPLSE